MEFFITLANSTKLCYTYDNLARVTARTVKSLDDDAVLSTQSFSYDAAGNVTDAPDSCFQYDTNNRLTVFNGNAVSYDLDGNVIREEELSPDFDTTFGIGFSGYFILGFTFEIGFDYDYYYSNYK